MLLKGLAWGLRAAALLEHQVQKFRLCNFGILNRKHFSYACVSGRGLFGQKTPTGTQKQSESFAGLLPTAASGCCCCFKLTLIRQLAAPSVVDVSVLSYFLRFCSGPRGPLILLQVLQRAHKAAFQVSLHLGGPSLHACMHFFENSNFTFSVFLRAQSLLPFSASGAPYKGPPGAPEASLRLLEDHNPTFQTPSSQLATS